MKTLCGSLFSVFIVLCLGCKQSEIDHFAHIADVDVKRVLRKGFDSAGGLNTFLTLDSVIFDKHTILYLPDGRTESEVKQLQRFKLSPTVSGVISWTDSLGTHQIVHTASESYKTLNGSKVEGSSDSAKKGFMSNYYVLFLPFKLLDPGVTLSHEGEAIVEGKTAEVIKATYSPETHDNHSTSDEWYLFFEKESGKVLANLVYHPPTYAFIENTKSLDDYPLRMNLYRQTWRTDADRNKEYLRGEFWYSNYKFTSIAQ